MVRRFLATVAVLLAFTAPAAHAARTFTVYVCDFRIRSDEVRFVLAIDPKGKAYAYDVQHGTTTPKLYPVSLRADGPDHYFVIYSFVSEAGDTHTLWTAKMRIPRKGGSARVNFEIRGFYGNPHGNGKCVIEKNVPLS